MFLSSRVTLAQVIGSIRIEELQPRCMREVVEGSGKKSLLALLFSYEGLLAIADGNFG